MGKNAHGEKIWVSAAGSAGISGGIADVATQLTVVAKGIDWDSGGSNAGESDRQKTHKAGKANAKVKVHRENEQTS